MGDRPRLKLLIAASGGGHLRQLLDLRPLWSQHDAVFASEPTMLAESLQPEFRVHYLPHFAWGMRNIGSLPAMIAAGFRNMAAAFRIIGDERPDVLLTTGAGSMYFLLLFARLRGARCVVIESFARFHRPSLFGRMARPLASLQIVQSRDLRGAFPDAIVCEPLQSVDAPRPPKSPLAFVATGTVLPFDRLVSGVAELKRAGLLPERVIAQVAEGGAMPRELECRETLPLAEIEQLMIDADLVFTHGGTGSMILALRQGCRVIAMPRDPVRHEHYDDHQFEVIDAFAARGLVTRVSEVDELAAGLARARAAVPVLATTRHDGLVALLERWLTDGDIGAGLAAPSNATGSVPTAAVSPVVTAP